MAKISVPPGVFRNGTQYQTAGRWYDANLVRWVGGQLRPVGGWVKLFVDAVVGKARGAHAWRTNVGVRRLAMGTSQKLYVFDGNTRYDITPVDLVGGLDDTIESLAYGAFTYGTGVYGITRPGGSGGVQIPAATWHLDNYGQNLVGCHTTDGRIFQWELNEAVKAAPLANAPTSNRGSLVTEQRHVMAFGANGNARLVAWSDKEAPTVWTPLPENEAGDIELQTEGQIICGRKVRGQILVLTDSDAHAMSYGGEFVFGRERVGNSCGIIGPNAIAITESFAMWMGNSRFWYYDGGGVQVLESDVADYVFGDINQFQGIKVNARLVGALGEIWFHYPSSGSVECDRYVIYNYREKHWSIGVMPRTIGLDAGVFTYPIAVGADNFVYRQEFGYLADGGARTSAVYAETGALEDAEGERISSIYQLIADEKLNGQVTFSFRGRQTPNDVEYSFGPYVVRTDGYVDTRVSGRQIVMRVAGAVDDDWRIGVIRATTKPGGRR